MTRNLALICAILLACASAAAAGFPTVVQDGRPYVELARVAATLGTRVDGTPATIHARVRAGGHLVTVTRNWSRVVVDGAVVVLDAPVRVRRGVWLVPHAFVDLVLPRLASQPSASPDTSHPRATATSRLVSPSTAEASTPTAPTPARPSLQDVRVRSYPSFTRVVLETSAPFKYGIDSAVSREARVRLTALAAEPRVESVRDGFITDVRVERDGADALVRIAFEAARGDVRATVLADPPRLMLDVVRPAERDASERRDRETPLRVIVLDAGHGGHDSGAVGPGGLMEKDVVLDVTRRVARLVDDRLGVKVLLSRDGDYFVPLRDRTSFANRKRADLFVSIHANAHREAANEGVETFFLSSEATDSAARHVAALENGVVKLERPAASGRVDVVKSILWELAQSEFQLESSRLAEVVQDSMTRSLRIPNRGVKQAGFYVLGGAAMPAVLIEIGFVTNPKEERKLKESQYRDDVARAIFDGIAEYKKQWDQRTRTALDRAR